MSRFTLFLLSGAIGLSLTGCAATGTPTLRGQSPSCDPGAWSSSTEYGPACQPGCQPGCPPGGAAACQSCDACCSGQPCLNLPFHPVHRNFHTYDVPSNLSYPEHLQPSIYQYPYYTTRGPTDFFQ